MTGGEDSCSWLLPLCLAMLNSAVQLIPSFELWKESGRSSTHYSEWSLEAVPLLNLPFANVLGSDREPGHQRYWAGHFFDRGYPLYYSLYLGLGAIILAAAALGASRDRRTLFLGLAAILFLVLASGGKSPLSGFLTSLPLISSLRYPVKFFVGSVFSISLLAGIGLESLFKRAGGRKRPAGPTLITLASFGLLLAAFSGRAAAALGQILGVTRAPETAEIRLSLISSAILGVVLALAVAASRVHDRARRVGSVLVIGLILLDLVYHNRNVNPLVSTSFFRASNVPASAPRPLRIYREDDVPNSLRRGSTDIRRLARYARETGYPLTGIGDGLYYLFDEDTLDISPPAYRRLANAVKVTGREARLKLLRAEGCDSYVSHTRLPGLSASQVDTSEGPMYFQGLAGPRHDVRIVHDAVAEAAPEDKIRTCLDAAFDPERDRSGRSSVGHDSVRS